MPGVDKAQLLVVRHGAGRGRDKRYLKDFLNRIKKHDSLIYNKLRFHYTGDPSPDLNGLSAVIFWLADPLRELYPSCFEEAKAISDAARERNIRIINPPEALSNTIKSVQYKIWSSAGIPTPVHYPFSNYDELDALLGEVGFPAILRPDHLHAQQSTFLCTDADMVRRLPVDDIAYPGTLTPLIDVRAAYRTFSPESVYACYHHKKRLYVFGDIIFTHHIFFGESPIVGLETSVFKRYTELRGAAFILKPWYWWKNCRACIAADIEYWQQGQEHPDIMRRAMTALGLDFGAIDYATMPDGRPILWEVNPYFYLPSVRKACMPRQRKLKERYDTISMAMRDFFHSLL